MFCRVAWCAGLLVCVPAVAQNVQTPTTVQLPSFSFFTVSTTVLVPDSARGYGRVYAGGNNYAASGRNEFGTPFLPSQRAIGAERRAAGLTVSAQIHDLHAMDEDHLLVQPELRAARARLQPVLPIVNAARPAQAAVRDEPLRSVAAIKQAREQKAAAVQAEALALLERGRKCEAEGKLGAAKVYYQMAATRAEGELREQIVAQLKALPDGRSSTNK